MSVRIEDLGVLLEQHPPPWVKGRVRELRHSRSQAVEVFDAHARLVLEVDSELLADGLIASVNLFYWAHLNAPVEEAVVIPWRGQEAES